MYLDCHPGMSQEAEAWAPKNRPSAIPHDLPGAFPLWIGLHESEIQFPIKENLSPVELYVEV